MAFGFSIWTRAELLGRLMPGLGRELVGVDVAELVLLGRAAAPVGAVARRARLLAAGVGPRVLGALSSRDDGVKRLYAIDRAIEEMFDELGVLDPAGARLALSREGAGAQLADSRLVIEDGMSLGADAWAMLSRLEQGGHALRVQLGAIACPTLPELETWTEPLSNLAQRLRERGGAATTTTVATELDPTRIATWLAPNELAEVRHAADAVARWLAEDGVSPASVSVVASRDRHGSLVRALARRGVPTWSDVSASDHLAGRLLMASLLAFGQRWPRAALVGFVETLDPRAGRALLADLHAVGSTDDRGPGHRRRFADRDPAERGPRTAAWLDAALDAWSAETQPLAAWLGQARQALRQLVSRSADGGDRARARAIARAAPAIDLRLAQGERFASLADRPASLERFTAAMGHLLGSTSIGSRPLGAAVRVCDVDSIPAHCSHLLAIGLSEVGLLRAEGASIAGLPEAPRRLLERAVGGRLAARRSLDVLRLLEAAGRARQAVLCRADRTAQGGTLSPSRVWVALADAGGGPRLLDHGHGLTEDGRATLRALQAGDGRRLDAPRVALDPEASAAVRSRLGITPAARGRVAWTTSASAIESYADCPFRFFARRVLGLEGSEDYEDELDARESGSLRHAVMASVFEALRHAELVPLRGAEFGPQERRVAIEAAEGALQQHAGSNRIGPTGLWRLETALIVRDVLRILETERAVAAGWMPRYFEREFAASEIPMPGAGMDERVVRLRGRIDRVDMRGDGKEREAMVLDYKSGAVEGKLSAKRLGRTQFQLPLYARSIRGELSVAAVDAALVSLRDGRRPNKTMLGLKREHPQVAMMLEGADDGAPVPAVGGRELVDADVSLDGAVWSLVLGIEAGRFDVAPFDPKTTCRGCGFEALCRIAEQREGAERGSDEP